MKAKKPINQNLSKDMKKQGHVSNRKPSNKKLSSEKELAETPKKGQYREPSSKKLSSETSLTKSKLTHIKEFNEFEKTYKSKFNENRYGIKNVKDKQMKKYKLINTTTKEEHLCDKVTIDGFDYYVSDEKYAVGENCIGEDEGGLRIHKCVSLS